MHHDGEEERMYVAFMCLVCVWNIFLSIMYMYVLPRARVCFPSVCSGYDDQCGVTAGQ